MLMVIVHCRTGSLEIALSELLECPRVHCRTGSLEIMYALQG
ncbi:hypothetical protein VC116063_003789 [Vibrio cholerae O1 str. 116063]|nr:hypothetical protein VC116063_003789 [Vibrio cholerae O1 str. 116063]